MDNKKRNRVSKLKSIRFSTRRYLLILGIFLTITVAAGAFFMGCDFSRTEIDDTEESSIVRLDLKKEGKINVLLLGVDVEGLRTDAIMIASYDVKEGVVNLLSIPRDTRMYVGTKYQKINAAHAIGGMKGKIAGPNGTIEAVTRITGIPVHYYVEFSFSAIDHFIDALGGVDFDVPDIEGKGSGMNYDDPVQNLHIHLKPGQQHLTGNKVQQLLRYRKSNKKGIGYADGDRGRVEMQQEFVKELVKQKLSPSLILSIPELYEKLKEDIKTNLTIADIIKYAGYFEDFKTENINAYQLPGVSNGTDYGASYWICDLDETKKLVETVFGYDASKITIDSPDGKSVSKNKKVTSSAVSSKNTVSEPEVPDEDDEDKEPRKQANKTPQPSESPKPSSEPGKDGNSVSDDKNDMGEGSDKDKELSESTSTDNPGDKKTVKETNEPVKEDSGGLETGKSNSVAKNENTDEKGGKTDDTAEDDTVSE